MAQSKPQKINAPKYNTSAATFIRSTLPGGRVLAHDGGVYLLRKIPMAPVADAKSIDERMAAFTPLMAAYEELASLSVITGTRRALARKNYRQTQTLMVNLKRMFAAPAGHPLAGFLAQSFPKEVTDQRILIMAVRLNDKVGGGKGGMKAIIESVAETLTVGGSPLADYDWDTKRVDAALSRCGFTTPTTEEIRIADSWWNHGRHADVPEMAHSEHLHIFSDTNSVNIADRAGREDCSQWPHPIPNHRSLTFASLDGFDFTFESPTSTRANWASGLVADDAVAISIRANIEPARVTRDELRRQRKRYLDDIRERAEQGKMERAEQEEMQATLEDIEGVYARDTGSATLTDASVLVAFDGLIEDIEQVGQGSAARLRIMQFRQREALAEMMIGSTVRANPRLHDMPSQTVAASGIQALSTVGDKPAGSALLGMTENDRQLAWVNPGAASAGDAAPMFVNLGATGSGKSLVMLWKAVQYAKLGRPQVIVDPKTGSDHSDVVESVGGTVYSLDSLAGADGIFDPIRFSARPEVGVELAASMLASIDPWGRANDFEVPVYNALKYGVDRGATCIGEALRIAFHDERATLEMVNPIVELANSSPLFRACVGFNRETIGLRVAESITYIKVGDTHLDLPEPGAIKEASIMQRVSLALVRMMVFGSAMALTGRGGVIHLDEAWVFLGAGKAEVERLGRLARSQDVLPELYTQRASDPLKAGLAGYISRGLILPIEDKDEAQAALELFKLEATPERMSRITAKATMADGESTAPNVHSMRALKDPKTGKVIRGTIGFYSDLAGRAVPVEIVLPPEFVRMASTTPADIKARQQEKLARLAA